MQTLKNTIIGWTPVNWTGVERQTPGDIGLVPFPDKAGLSTGYAMTTGACWVHARSLSFEERRLWVAAEALTSLVRDGIEPEAMHAALLPLAEYRSLLPLDAILDPHWTQVEEEERGCSLGDFE